MLDILYLILAIIGGLVLLAVIIGLIALLRIRISRRRLPKKIILETNLEGGLIEYVPNDRAAKTLLSDRISLRDMVEALERAGRDDRVAGLVVRTGATRIGIAQAQELRDAIFKFRSKKKFAYIFSESFGEAGPGTGSYYLATAFDKIWLQPSGDLAFTGLMMESPFLRGLLEKLGVTPRMNRRKEYKSAMNTFTEKGYTPEHREETEKIMNSWFSQIIRAVAETRRMTEEQVRTLIDRGPFLANEALEAGLVDALDYRDQVYDEAKKKAGEGAKLLYLSRYFERTKGPHKKSKTIALIYGVGRVVSGKSGYDLVFGDVKMGSETLSSAFRAAIEDKNIKAILFRVDSPGGSYVASDTIWQETIRAKKSGKPVIVSMGNVAGSGGYFVAMHADKIIAQPGTITGSIGVVSGKMHTAGFWDKLGVVWDELHIGENATMWTGAKDYTPSEWERLEASLDRVYDDFTSKVAEGRKLPKEQVLEIAKGRIWTGEQAKKVGLVDELGGFQLALTHAKKAAGIADEEEVRLKVFPPKKSRLQMLLKGRPESSEHEQLTELLTQALELIRPVVRQLRVPGSLSMPEEF